MGHGWVHPNPGGAVARCGGPNICSACWREAIHAGWLLVPPERVIPKPSETHVEAREGPPAAEVALRPNSWPPAWLAEPDAGGVP